MEPRRGAEKAADTPGMMVGSIPWERNLSTSSPPLPNTNGSPIEKFCCCLCGDETLQFAILSLLGYNFCKSKNRSQSAKLM